MDFRQGNRVSDLGALWQPGPAAPAATQPQWRDAVVPAGDTPAPNPLPTGDWPLGRAIAQIGGVALDRLGDLLAGAAADEQGLAAPLDRDLLARLNLAQVELDRGKGQGIAGRVHLVDERPCQRAHGSGCRNRGGNVNEIAPVRVFARGVWIGICAHDGVGHLKLPFVWGRRAAHLRPWPEGSGTGP